MLHDEIVFCTYFLKCLFNQKYAILYHVLDNVLMQFECLIDDISLLFGTSLLFGISCKKSTCMKSFWGSRHILGHYTGNHMQLIIYKLNVFLNMYFYFFTCGFTIKIYISFLFGANLLPLEYVFIIVGLFFSDPNVLHGWKYGFT
jgi:hypothetical protein